MVQLVANLAYAHIIAAIAIQLAIAISARTSFAEDDPKACAAVQGDAQRLECYDLIFRKSSTTRESTNEWVVTEEVSKIDDSRNVFLTLQSIEPIANQYGTPVRLELNITCRERKTDLYIFFGGYFMSSTLGGGVVTYRIDDRPAQKKPFAESNDHKALGLWSASEAIPFIKQMFAASKLLIRAVPYSQNAVTAEFRIAGLQEAIAPLAQACGWHLS
jgi:type VI secretion system protein VasI